MRLLLAEDELMLSDALVEILNHSHYSVDAVYNGQDALDYLLNGNYDGAVLDIMMPRMDGLRVLQRVREAGLTLPVLLLTAKGEIEDRVAGLDCGADDYLTKPFDARELLARIRAMTRRQPELQDNVLRVGDLALDRADFSLTGPTDKLHLANKDFQVLEMLMANAGQTIPTERLIEKIWGYDSESDASLIWVYISGLRRKIAAVGAHVQIRAARGVGYSVEEAAT
jgi:two-component system response regulator ArlR